VAKDVTRRARILIAAELEARVCAVVIFGTGGLEPGIERTRQDDEHDGDTPYPEQLCDHLGSGSASH
jgi:hypothetical protein